MLGFDFPDNFNLPYISRSILNLAALWHITLSAGSRNMYISPLAATARSDSPAVQHFCSMVPYVF